MEKGANNDLSPIQLFLILVSRERETITFQDWDWRVSLNRHRHIRLTDIQTEACLSVSPDNSFQFLFLTVEFILPENISNLSSKHYSFQCWPPWSESPVLAAINIKWERETRRYKVIFPPSFLSYFNDSYRDLDGFQSYFSRLSSSQISALMEHVSLRP